MTVDDAALRNAAAGIAGSSSSSPSSSQPSLLEDDITPFPSPMLSPQELEDLSRKLPWPPLANPSDVRLGA